MIATSILSVVLNSWNEDGKDWGVKQRCSRLIKLSSPWKNHSQSKSLSLNQGDSVTSRSIITRSFHLAKPVVQCIFRMKARTFSQNSLLRLHSENLSQRLMVDDLTLSVWTTASDSVIVSHHILGVRDRLKPVYPDLVLGYCVVAHRFCNCLNVHIQLKNSRI